MPARSACGGLLSRLSRPQEFEFLTKSAICLHAQPVPTYSQSQSTESIRGTRKCASGAADGHSLRRHSERCLVCGGLVLHSSRGAARTLAALPFNGTALATSLQKDTALKVNLFVTNDTRVPVMLAYLGLRRRWEVAELRHCLRCP